MSAARTPTDADLAFLLERGCTDLEHARRTFARIHEGDRVNMTSSELARAVVDTAARVTVATTVEPDEVLGIDVLEVALGIAPAGYSNLDDQARTRIADAVGAALLLAYEREVSAAAITAGLELVEAGDGTCGAGCPCDTTP